MVARLLAAGANAEHGVRRDNETKRKAVCTALAEGPSWSDHRSPSTARSASTW
jgi:hypothetical protein